MELTELQQRRIERYLGELETGLAELTPETRRAAMGRVKARISEELRRLNARFVANADLEAVLQGIGSPEALAAAAQRSKTVAPAPPPSPKLSARRFAADETRWLGVCATLARHFDIEPWIVRLIAVLLGLALGPIALIFYLGAYFTIYFGEDKADFPKIHAMTLAKSVLMTFVIAIGLRVAAETMLWGLLFGFNKLTGLGAADIARWLWLREDASSTFLLALLFSLPWAVLGGLPAAGQWPETLRKLAQAILALYAVWLAVGLGAALAGMALSGAHAVGPSLDALP